MAYFLPYILKSFILLTSFFPSDFKSLLSQASNLINSFSSPEIYILLNYLPLTS